MEIPEMNEIDYYRIVNLSVDLICIAGMDGYFKYVNFAWENILGYSQVELLSRPFLDFIHPDDHGKNDEEVEKLAAGQQSIDFENRYLHKDGSTRHIFWTAVPFADEKKIYCIGRDVTDRKRATEELQNSKDLYSNLIENLNDILYKVDAHGTISYVSPPVISILGYTPAELVGQHFMSFIHPDDKDKILSVFKDSLKGKISPTEYRFQTKGGDFIWVMTSSHPAYEGSQAVGLNGILSDISERKNAEIALLESERRFRSMMEALKDPVYICSPEFKVEYMNPAMIERAGQDAKGELCFKGLHDLNEKCAWCRHDMIQHDISSEFEIVSPKDNRSYLISQTPIIHEDGSVSKMTVYKDITNLRSTEIQLHQAQKMESVGRLAGGVAHDYNNALSVIMGFTDLVLMELDPTGPLSADLNEVLKAARRATDITRQLLAFARKQTIAPKVLDLNGTIDNMLKMLRRLIGEDIDLAWLPGTNLWRIKMDPSQMDQILANLCVNARDAIDGVGKVTVETDMVTLDEAYCVDHTGFVPGEFVLLSVSDNGCGIDKEILDNIFEPFFTTKDVDKGTGLGLSTVYGIVKQNNGFINVYSEPDKGTTIKIYLPRHEGKAAEIQGENTEKIPQGHGETILVVEDDLPILKLTKRILDGLGYIVLIAATPNEAMDLARGYSGKIHLVVTDVIMPEMNGRELSEQLKSIYPDLNFMFMSGYTANAIAHQGVLDEGVYFIQKPFSKNDLATIVRKILDE